MSKKKDVEEVKAEVVDYSLTNKDIDTIIDKQLEVDILQDAYMLEGEPLNIVTGKESIQEEIMKLKKMILLEGVGTMSPKQLYYSGRIKLPPIKIQRIMEKLVTDITPSETKLMGLQGVAMFDEVIEKAQDWLERDDNAFIRDRNNTAALLMMALEKKRDWLESFGFKPRDMENVVDDSGSFNISRMREIMNQVREVNKANDK